MHSMNSTQKLGWITLFSALLGVVGFAYVGSIIFFRRMPIRARAATISLAASWTLLVLVVAVLGLTLGQTGSIPVYLLTVILFVVAEVSTLAYGVAVLVQYGRGGH